MRTKIILLLLLVFLEQCRLNTEKPYCKAINNKLIQLQLKKIQKEKCVCYYEAIMIKNGLVDIKTLDSSIVVNMRYSGINNFLRTDIYGCLEKAYLQPDVAQKLVKAQQILKTINPKYSLIVYDAARPIQVQRILWEKIDLPISQKVNFVSNPFFGSIHNYGAAVDVSILDETHTPIDMGSDYDDFSEISGQMFENYFLQKGQLTPQQIKNRQLLRYVMYSAGFFGIESEWWHFNAMSREQAMSKYNLLE